jgi:hypothetical protein
MTYEASLLIAELSFLFAAITGTAGVTLIARARSMNRRRR